MSNIRIYFILNLSLWFFFLPVYSQDIEEYYFHIRSIEINGNKITHESIIHRELEFSKGDSLTASEILEKFKNSENNLLNTGLFNFAKLNYRIAGFDIDITINLTERWYIWPVPILEISERNLPAWLKDPGWDELNYGGWIYWNNFRGRNEKLELKTRFGYKEHFALNYFSSNLDKNKKHGLQINLNKYRQHEMILENREDKPFYFKSDEKYILESFHPFLRYSYRPKLYSSHFLSLGYHSYSLAIDSVREQYLGIQTGNLNFFEIAYSFEFDKRDSKIYPLKGNLLRAEISRLGLGLSTSLKNPVHSFIVNMARHSELNPRFYLANMGKVRIRGNKDRPEIFETALGYETYLRGFEYYTINGNNYFISINNLKYTLIPPQAFRFPVLPWEQFRDAHYALYANLFFDMAYVQGNLDSYLHNQLQEKLLFSIGTGIDLVSYYDQVLRLEFTVNSLKKPGIYLHFETPFFRW